MISKQLAEVVETFDKTTLADMEHVKLMDRTDVKYIFRAELLPQLLEEIRRHYQILEINAHRVCPYETLYYDTPDLRFYHQHQAGRKNRYKVRARHYVSSDTCFFELKCRTNKGRTVKTRIPQTAITEELTSDSLTFLAETAVGAAVQLSGIMWVSYKRLTLVSTQSLERVTIDLDMQFYNPHRRVEYGDLAIVEIKQPKRIASPFAEVLKKRQLRRGGLSKYCLGIISLFEGVKHNRFKLQLARLHQLNQTCQVLDTRLVK